MADKDKSTNVIEYKTADGRTAYGAPDSKGALEAKARSNSKSKTTEKDSSAAKKA
jgi:hypothetical protein